jgi:hypothetical protein
VSGERERRRHLRAVEECQALLRRELHWREIRVRECLRGGHRARADARHAFADQYACEMRKRGQVARCADRTLRGYARDDAAVVHFRQGFDHLPTHPRIAAGERGDLEGDDQANGRVVEQRAGAGRM